MMENNRTPDQIRNLIAFLLVGAFIAFVPLFVYKTIPEANKDIITYMVGQISGMALMALGFYYTNKVGQDALDEKRVENTGKLADAITAAASNSEPKPDIEVAPGDKVVVAGEQATGKEVS